jgi:hypothetical protein
MEAVRSSDTQHYMASQPKRPGLEYSSPSKLQTLLYNRFISPINHIMGNYVGKIAKRTQEKISINTYFHFSSNYDKFLRAVRSLDVRAAPIPIEKKSTHSS